MSSPRRNARARTDRRRVPERGDRPQSCILYTLHFAGRNGVRAVSGPSGVREMDPLVLTVDMAGLPQAWVELEEAITYHAKQMVAWSVGREVREFRGGWQKNGVRSRIATRSILAIKGAGAGAHRHAPGLTNAMLFVRDRQVCAYCGGRFMIRDLSRDHVVPVSRGGKDSWTNTVTACRSLQHAQGRSLARAIGDAAALCALRAQPARALHPAQPADSRRPDGVPARRRADGRAACTRSRSA